MDVLNRVRNWFGWWMLGVWILMAIVSNAVLWLEGVHLPILIVSFFSVMYAIPVILALKVLGWSVRKVRQRRSATGAAQN
jgi:hypothetical protein